MLNKPNAQGQGCFDVAAYMDNHAGNRGVIRIYNMGGASATANEQGQSGYDLVEGGEQGARERRL